MNLVWHKIEKDSNVSSVYCTLFIQITFIRSQFKVTKRRNALKVLIDILCFYKIRLLYVFTQGASKQPAATTISGEIRLLQSV